ncbi:cation:proton antiporter [Mariprofundus sp. KV]|uniref:cation:proton antiporter n=1 Tax=Mariprofundus sp. KV TaxID=2608715 RepID=UPI0015A063BD|nr:cation:proton antiporter [Mariprofundus sp. KV]NWF35941.1 cation:proton antiporter [Mariprofundus sp. KV]
MHMDPIMPALVASIVAILAVGLVFHALRQPNVIAYLVAGIFLGPSVLGMISDQQILDRLGQFGVVMLMFFIGMEVSPQKMVSKWQVALLGTCLQIGVSTSLIALIGYFFDWPLVLCVLLGFIVSLSSTAVVLNLLQARNELDTTHGQNALNVLLAQDIAVIPMLIIISMLSGEQISSGEMMLQMVGGAMLIGLCTWIVIRPDFRIPLIGKAVKKDHEFQVFGALLLCFGLALITGLFSLSSALGAFVAGMVVSAAKEAKWVHQSLEPFKTVFVALFFVSVGMLVDVGFIVENWGKVVLLALIVLILNTAINASVFRLLGESWGDSVYTGSILAQIGEFSFILAAVGVSSAVISQADYQLAVAVIVVSLLASPFFIAHMRKYASCSQGETQSINGP